MMKCGKIIRQKFIKREDLRNNSNTYYVFGDNYQRKGLGGQAKEMRGEHNAIGICVKWHPDMRTGSFFHDRDLLLNIELMLKGLRLIDYSLRRGHDVVIPEDGIGTGRAELKERAPKTYEYLQRMLNDIIEGSHYE